MLARPPCTFSRHGERARGAVQRSLVRRFTMCHSAFRGTRLWFSHLHRTLTKSTSLSCRLDGFIGRSPALNSRYLFSRDSSRSLFFASECGWRIPLNWQTRGPPLGEFFILRRRRRQQEVDLDWVDEPDEGERSSNDVVLSKIWLMTDSLVPTNGKRQKFK